MTNTEWNLTWIASSHLLSTEAVASSKQIIFGLGWRSKARAKQINCLCPADISRPDSPTSRSNHWEACKRLVASWHFNKTSSNTESFSLLVIFLWEKK